MNGFKGTQFTRVKGISDIRRLPIRDKIRLGVKAIAKSGKSYPREVDYFVCPPEVQKVYGEKPTELDVRFPLEDLDTIFPTSYIFWGAGAGWKCRGNGEIASRIEEPDGTRHDGAIEIPCPCALLEDGRCKLRAQLRFFLERVSLGELFAINLGSFHSIVDINSGITFTQALVGKFAMIPLKLKRVPRETHGSGRKEIHWTLKVVLESNDLAYVNSLRESTKYLPEPKYLLPQAIFENPAMDEGATVVEVVDEETGEILEEAPATAGLPTQEEEAKTLEQAGMVPSQEEKKSPPLDKTGTLSTYASLINSFKTAKELNHWVGKERENVPESLKGEWIKLVNDRLSALVKAKAKG